MPGSLRKKKNLLHTFFPWDEKLGRSPCVLGEPEESCRGSTLGSCLGWVFGGMGRSEPCLCSCSSWGSSVSIFCCIIHL